MEHFPESLKTKELAAFLRKLGAERSVLVSPLAEFRQSLARAGRNLRGVVVKDPKTVTAADVVKSRHLVMTPESWAVLEQRIAPRRDA